MGGDGVGGFIAIQESSAKSRGAEVLIEPELHQRLMEVVSPEFRDFLQAVQATGARPGEVARVEVKDVQWEAGCWVLTEENQYGWLCRLHKFLLPEGMYKKHQLWLEGLKREAEAGPPPP